MVLLVLSFAGAAKAQPVNDESEARLWFRRAEVHFRRREFQAAHDAYQAAHHALPLPDFLFDMGQCQRELGSLDRAVELYREFIRVSPDPAKRATAEALLHELEPSAPGASPETAAAEPPPPPVAPRVSPPAPPAARRSTAGRGTTGARHVQPAAGASSGRIGAVTWLAAAAGLASVGASVLFALQASTAQSELDDPDLDCGASLTRCLEIADEGRRASVLRNSFLAAGGVVLVTAGVLFVLDLTAAPRSTADVPSGTSVSLSLGPRTGLGGEIRW
jgi:hypothetical protein